jgi:hypothetical protein
MLRLGAAVRRRADRHGPLARDIRVVVNGNDHTVNRSAIDELVAEWSARGGRVSMFELPDSPHLPHDIVDPQELSGDTAKTYPVFVALLAGSAPAPHLAKRLVLP